MDARAVTLRSGDAQHARQLTLGGRGSGLDAALSGSRRPAEIEMVQRLALPGEAGPVEILAKGIAVLRGERQEEKAEERGGSHYRPA